MSDEPQLARRNAHQRENPVLRWLAFTLCAGAFLGALLWKAMGW